MRWVKETFWPAFLSSLRRASIVVTVTVRNEVAVGIERLSSMYLASIAAPPLRTVVAPPAGAAAGAAPLPPLAAARTSALVILPDGPLPETPPRSMPSAAATRAATGETLASWGSEGAEAGAEAPLPVGASGAAAGAAPGDVVIRAIAWPTVTVSPSSARISVIVPDAGAGSSMSTLSVEISTTVWPSATASPTLTAHSRIVPSVTDSPPAGVTLSMVSPSAGAAASASGGGSVASGSSVAAAGAPPFVEISASSCPTSTVSPSGAWILTMVPEAGLGTSASTLSVEISTMTSSASIESPSCLCHSRTVPSVTDSPIAGMVTCTVVLTAIEPWTLARDLGPGGSLLAALLADELVAADERTDAADHRHGDGQAHVDRAAPEGDEREAAHDDPAEPVGHPQDELRLVQSRDEPDRQQPGVDRRVGEREALEAPEGQPVHAPAATSSPAMRRSGSSPSSDQSAMSAGHQAWASCSWSGVTSAPAGS